MKKMSMLFFSLVLVLTAMIFVPMTAQAAQPLVEETCSSDVDLYSRLTSTDKKWIKLTKDMALDWNSENNGTWCTIQGIKILDLNGHTLKIVNSTAKTATLFAVPEGADLTILDSGSNGAIQFQGRLDDNGTLQYRNLFRVNGMLTINGGYLQAGQGTKSYNALYVRYIYRYIYGTGIDVQKNGTVIVNDAVLYGIGCGQSAVNVSSACSHVYINGGTFYAKCGANGLGGSPNTDNTTVRAGYFDCQTDKYIKENGQTKKGYDVGCANVTSAVYDENQVAVTGSNTEFFIRPNATQKPNHDLTAAGTISGSDILLTTDQSVISSTYDHKTCYWPMNQVNGPYSAIGSEHTLTYAWHLYNSSGVPISASVKTGDGVYVGSANNTIDVMKDFKDFKFFKDFIPVKGEEYIITCDVLEKLGPFKSVMSYSKPYRFKIVDDINVPSISRNPAVSVAYEVGGSVTLTAEARGSNLSYRWQIFNTSANTWYDLSESSGDVVNPTLVLNNLSKSSDGVRYRLRVSNAAGSVFSSACTLQMKNTTVNPVITGLSMPMNGEPLDPTAMTSTPGCSVKEVKWHTIENGILSPDFIPYAGRTVFCDIIVEAQNGINLGSASIDGWTGGKAVSTSNPSNTSKRYSFMVDVAAPDGGVAIDGVTLEMDEPTVGSALPSAWPANMGYGDTISRDVRYSTSGGTSWFLDGKKITQLDDAYTVKEGNTYKAEVILKPAEGYYFTEYTKVLLNGEFLQTKLEGTSLKVMMEYDYTPEAYVFPFTDVVPSSWYYEWVVRAHKMGLIDGMSPTIFEPDGNMTYAQAITLAARMNQKYTTGSVTLQNGTVNWYDTYVEYCLNNGIIDSNYSTVINNKIDRSSYVHIFAKALPDSALTPKNTIPDNSIPDVKVNSPYAEDIYKLYRAGILNGSDPTGTFKPTSNIKRSEVAAILVRMMDSSVRVDPPADLAH